MRDPEARLAGLEEARLSFIVTVSEGEGAQRLSTLSSTFGLLLDRSSSMGADGKWPAVQAAGIHAIDLAEADGEVVVIAFNSQPVLLGSTRGGLLQDAPLKLALRGMRPESGTAIGAAMGAALAQLRSRHGVRRLAVLSDGQTQDEDLCYRMADAFAREHIPVDFLATDDVNITLAQRLADATGGRLEYLTRLTSQELARFFGQQMQASQSVVAQNVRVRVSLRDGARLALAAACYPDIIPGMPGANVEVGLGDLVRADRLQFYGELVLPMPSQDARVQAGEIVVSYDLPQAHRMNDQLNLPLAVTFASGAHPAPDAEVLARMQQVKAKLELDQIANTSDPAQAMALLQSAQRRTRLAGDPRKTQVITGLIDDLRRTNVISEGARKTAITAGRRTKIVP
jgi:hypothetical protein